MKLQAIALLLATAVIVPIGPVRAQGGIGGQPKNPVTPTSDTGTVTNTEGASATGSTGSGTPPGTSDGFDRATSGSTARASTAPVPIFLEGAISFRVTDDNGTSHDMQYLTKDGKVRFDVSDPRGGSAVMIIDPVAQKMLILIPEQKMYMERPLTGGTPSKTVASKSSAPIFTGKKEMIAGYQCEHVLFTDDDGSKVDACVASGLGSFMRPPSGNPMAGPPRPANDWSSKLAKGAFPLKVTKGSNVVFQVTRIEKKPLDSSLFTAPAGWQKLGGMPGMPPMR